MDLTKLRSAVFTGAMALGVVAFVVFDGGVLAQDRVPTHAATKKPGKLPVPSRGATSWMPVAMTEPFDKVKDKMSREKSGIMKRQMALLEERYDMSDKPVDGVTMTRGTKVQGGVRVKLPKGVTWAQLAEILFSDNFMHDLKAERFFDPVLINGRMAVADGAIKTFPLRGIKESPPYLHDDRLLTLDDTVEFFNLVLGTRLTEAEKKDLVAYMYTL